MLNYSVERLTIKSAVSALKGKIMFSASNLSLSRSIFFPKKSFGRLSALLLSSEYWQLLCSGLGCFLLSVPENPAVENKTLERIKTPSVHSVSYLGCQLWLLHRVRLLKRRHPSENVKRGAAEGCLGAPPSLLVGVRQLLTVAGWKCRTYQSSFFLGISCGETGVWFSSHHRA